MVDAVAMAGAQDAQIVSARGQLRQEIADLETRLPARLEWAHRPQKRVGGHFAARHDRSKTLGQWLAGVSDQFRFGIEEIDVAGATVHKEVNDALSAWREVGGFGTAGRSFHG